MLPGRYVWIFRIVLHPPAEAHSGTGQASKLDLFARIVNSFEFMLLTILLKFHCRCLKGHHIAQLLLIRKFYCFRKGPHISFKYARHIIYVARWWEKYLSKRSPLKHTCSWRVNLLYYEYWTDKQKYFYVYWYLLLILLIGVIRKVRALRRGKKRFSKWSFIVIL